jgi:hypothetical protein
MKIKIESRVITIHVSFPMGDDWEQVAAAIHRQAVQVGGEVIDGDVEKVIDNEGNETGEVRQEVYCEFPNEAVAAQFEKFCAGEDEDPEQRN